MEDPIQREIEKIRTAIAGLEAQKAVLGDDILAPALESLREKLAALEARQQSRPGPAGEGSLETRPAALPSDERRPDERRIVTVLFADIVGSTSIAEKLDPEDWGEIVAQVHAMAGSAVERQHGQVFQYLGDGLLALFGAEASREGDPERAVRAGLEIQTGLGSLHTDPPLQMRVGIHSGWVLLGELGSQGKREYTATGDAMNLAARLQSAAPAGGVLISQETYRLVRGLFDLAAQPPLAVKGKREPVQTYLVQGARSRPFHAVTRGVTGLEVGTIGREAELDQLRAAYRRAVESRGLVWAQLVGEPGIGKSRLLDEMLDFFALQPEEIGLLKARALPGDENHAYALVRSMWFDRFEIAEDLPLPAAEARWQEAFLKLGGEGNQEAAHALGLLVGLPFAGSPTLDALRSDPLLAKGRAFVVSRDLLAVVRSKIHVVALLEDVHWGDPASWEYLLQVAAESAPAGKGLFVLATARPEWRPPRELLELPGYLQIDLAPLSEAASRSLAGELLSSIQGVPEEVAGQIARRSEGVPYYAEEMVNWFIDRGIVDISRIPWRFDPARLQDVALPATLEHLLLTRLSSLGEPERAVLQRGSIFGRSFWEGGLAALDLPGGSRLLPGLEPRNFVHGESQSRLEGEKEWSFHHNLLHQVTYESVLKRERKAWHRQAAAWLEIQARQAGRLDEFVELLGEHAERGGESRAAAGWYVRAGERAQQRGAPQLARTFFDRALLLAPAADQELRWRILLGRDEALGTLGDSQGRQADDLALLALASELGGDDRLAEAHYRHGFALQNAGDDLAAIQAFEAGLEAARRAGNRSTESLLTGVKVVSLVRLGRMDEAALAAEAVIAASPSVAGERRQSGLLNNAAHYYMAAGDYFRAVQILDRQNEIQARLGNLREQLACLANLGYVLALLGRFDEAIGQMEQALGLAQKIGARRDGAYNRLNLGLAYFCKGETQAARRVLEESLAELSSVGDQFGLAAGRSYLAQVLEGAGELQEAGRLFSEAAASFRSLNAHGYAADAQAGLARCAWSMGQPEEAARAVREVWGYIQEHGVQAMEFPIRACLVCGQILAAVGEEEQSRRAVELGVRELAQRAGRISDTEWRRNYLENIPEHREILEMVRANPAFQ